MRTENIVVFF